jgi:hypothetical protein
LRTNGFAEGSGNAQKRSRFSLPRPRRREPALSIGAHVKAEAIGDVLSYRRFHAGRWITVELNFSAEPRIVARKPEAQEVLISTHLDRAEKLNGQFVELRANEGLVMAPAA